MEVREYRCCMCPQREAALEICPAGPRKADESICDFVVTWTDERGWKYKVMPGIGNDQFKGRYQDEKHDGRTGWKGMRQLPWQSTFDKAQEDLNRLAIRKQWTPVCLSSGGRDE